MNVMNTFRATRKAAVEDQGRLYHQMKEGDNYEII